MSDTVKSKSADPYSKSGQGTDKSSTSPVSPQSGFGGTYGGKIMWNNVELTRPRTDEKPTDRPNVGYCNHAHSRYAGGALDINSVELVEYNVPLNSNWESDVPNLKEWNSVDYSKHMQDYWQKIDGILTPEIKSVQNTAGNNIKKIGTIAATFNADTRKWGMTTYEIDVKNTYLVQRDENGDIVDDDNGNPKRAALWNEDSTKSNVVWDAEARVWRFYAVYSD